MAPETYELVAMGMRYWFVALGVLIALSCWRWLRVDSKAYQDALDLLPDAGLVGELVDMSTGHSIPLTREGTMGSGRACDMRVEGLHKRELSLEFEEGMGVKVVPLRGAHPVSLDGVPVNGTPALHGTRIAVGDRLFRVRLFAGLDVPDRIASAPQTDDAWSQPVSAIAEDGGDIISSGDVHPEQEHQELPDPFPEDTQQPHVYEDISQPTWQYAVPPELMHVRSTKDDNAQTSGSSMRTRSGRRRRRSSRRDD